MHLSRVLLARSRTGGVGQRIKKKVGGWMGYGEHELGLGAADSDKPQVGVDAAGLPLASVVRTADGTPTPPARVRTQRETSGVDMTLDEYDAYTVEELRRMIRGLRQDIREYEVKLSANAGWSSRQETDVRKEEEETRGRIRELNAKVDLLTGRGVVKHLMPYSPPSETGKPDEVEALVLECLNETTSQDDASSRQDDWTTMPLDTELKFRLLTAMENLANNHSVPNSRLHEIETVQDVIDFYRQPVSNLGQYTSMGRMKLEEDKPENLNVLEDYSLFHPDDTDELHGGVTAFPGTGRRFDEPRMQRLYRQYASPTRWYHYEDPHYDATLPPRDAPWLPRNARRADTPS